MIKKIKTGAKSTGKKKNNNNNKNMKNTFHQPFLFFILYLDLLKKGHLHIIIIL